MHRVCHAECGRRQLLLKLSSPLRPPLVAWFQRRRGSSSLALRPVTVRTETPYYNGSFQSRISPLTQIARRRRKRAHAPLRRGAGGRRSRPMRRAAKRLAPEPARRLCGELRRARSLGRFGAGRSRPLWREDDGRRLWRLHDQSRRGGGRGGLQGKDRAGLSRRKRAGAERLHLRARGGGWAGIGARISKKTAPPSFAVVFAASVRRRLAAGSLCAPVEIIFRRRAT